MGLLEKPGVYKSTYVNIQCGPSSVIHHAHNHSLFLLLSPSCSLLNALLGRPCVDCHAFEFMQRALQDLKKTAYNLDTRVRKHSTSFLFLFFFFLLFLILYFIMEENVVDRSR